MSLKDKRNDLLRYVAIAVLAYLMMGFFALITLKFKPLDPLSSAVKNFSFTDIYYEILNESANRDTSKVVTIVDMTKLYRRGDLAKVMEDIESCHPKVIGVDVVFDVEKDDFAGNDSLITVASMYDNIVFSMKLLDYKDSEVGFTKEIHSFFGNYTPIKEGFSNMPRGGHYDSMKRILPLRYVSNGEEKPSLIAKTVSEYVGKDLWNEEGSKSELSINFSPMTFQVLDPDEVVLHPELIEGRIVLLGAMYEEVDTHWTPAGKIAGVNLLAFAAQTLIDKKEVHQLPFLLQLLSSFILTLLIYSLQKQYTNKTNNSKKLFVRFILGSSYMFNVGMFFFTSILLGICFYIFAYTQVSINIAWALASLAFMSTSSNMLEALTNYVKARIERKKQKYI